MSDHYDRYNGMEELLGTNLAEVGTNLISRQAAIDYFVLNVGFHDEDGYPIEDTDELRKIWTEYFDGIPPIQPKRGRWILDRSGAYCCSKCMEPCAGYVMMKPRDKFCKMCGSRNEVTE